MQGSGVLCTLLQRYVARLDERGFLAAGNYIRCCGSEMIFSDPDPTFLDYL
jgi:hypothetical protein